MRRRSRDRIRAVGLMMIITGMAAVGSAGSLRAQSYTNLQVLPVDISRSELNDIMLDNLTGLGLPRRSGEGCLHCHAGSTETPRASWDFASDEMPAKTTARLMMAMVREINEGYLARIGVRVAPSLEVGCYTCHAGRTDPTPLPELLMREYAEGGLDALDRTYRATRARYYEADAYDFRVGTLTDVANRLTQQGEMDDAAQVHELNIEYNDVSEARGGLIRLRLVQALEAGGPAAMIERYHRLTEEQPQESFDVFTVDPLGWLLQRSGREDAAMRLFELNYALYPTAFTATESLAYAVAASGDLARGIAMAEEWITAHPEHRGGHQLLAELRR